MKLTELIVAIEPHLLQERDHPGETLPGRDPVVPGVGFEPTRLSAADFKSAVSTVPPPRPETIVQSSHVHFVRQSSDLWHWSILAVSRTIEPAGDCAEPHKRRAE